MNKDALLSGMVFLILALSNLPNPVSADTALFTLCSPNPSYTPNSPFEKNLKRLLQSLSSNTSLTEGFHTEHIGDGSDVVYGRVLCRGDVKSTDCQKCVQNASRAIVNECKQSEDAIIWYEFCQLQYSFQHLSSMMVYTGKFPDWNNQWKKVLDPVHFDVILTNLMNNLSDAAAFDASKAMFATGEAKFSRNGTVYGLVQCTRDISGSDCKKCLDSALEELKQCCSSRQGGIVLNRPCNVRFQVDGFYRNTARGDKKKIWLVVAVAVACMLTFAVAVLIVSYAVYVCRKKETQKDEERSQKALLPDLQGPSRVAIEQESDIVDSQELPIMDLATIRTATDDFLDSNKLGQGGFGTVYKGVLPNGKEIAVKRLSRKSRQGLKEFKNEIILIAKLQHKNLVRLLGCGIEGQENLLIYEFMPNKSLDIFIFDSERRAQLHWETCYNIIVGIARGLLYLHDDSRLRVIHRDLKPSNVLLDHEMVAKISDFGMARIFCENQNTANTRRVVGTYGYMAPEYAMEGLFSVKSDVFSLGVIILEIISGKKNSGFYLSEHAQTLVTYAWRLWNEGKEMELVEPMLIESCPTTQVLRCIQIGLLCVQEDPADRPTMSAVVVLLGNQSIALPEPKQPAFAVSRVIQNDNTPTSSRSVNQMTFSSISPR